MRKTHLQVVLEVIPPPMTGPKPNAIALGKPMLATNCAYLLAGTISIKKIMFIANEPPPPIPWNERRMMLHKKNQYERSTERERGRLFGQTSDLQLSHGLCRTTGAGEYCEDEYTSYQNLSAAEDIAELGENDDNGDISKEVTR